MSRNLSNSLLNQIFSQSSDDPFLMIMSLNHPSFAEEVRIVNNSSAITSRGKVFLPFPMKVTLPADDGETQREVQVSFDNVSLELIGEFRSVTDYIDVKIEMILASNPNYVEIELGELKLRNITYNSKTIEGKLFMDDFLNTELPSESYTPTNFPGLFA